MANNFPHVEVIGMDLAPNIMNEDNIPNNCRFELEDVNRGLPHFYGQLDLVHMRRVSSGVSHRRLCPSPKIFPVKSLVLFYYTLPNAI